MDRSTLTTIFLLKSAEVKIFSISCAQGIFNESTAGSTKGLAFPSSTEHLVGVLFALPMKVITRSLMCLEKNQGRNFIEIGSLT